MKCGYLIVETHQNNFCKHFVCFSVKLELKCIALT